MTAFKTINIDICIATYKRQELLGKLLKSLSKQTLINSIKLRIIIIDNDPEQSARLTVENFFYDKDIVYIYDVQPKKNISLTRNKALDFVTADYLAFIDDDEWAVPNWLNLLLNASQQYNADIVFGPVLPQFPEDTPEWILKGGFFYRNNKTGAVLTHGASGNVLIRAPKAFKNTLYFDPKYGLTGGEDTELFHRLYLLGAKMIWCNEALAYEDVPRERMTVQWLVKRALRGGQIYAKIYLKDYSLYKRITWFIKRISYLVIAIISLPVAFFMGKSSWVWVLRKLMANYGQLSMLFINDAYQEYK
ncbi:glycosyltransferase family 2 protein [Methylicorpusculum oleiharenae]|uniref:glycosyltransferase n=1 Tax=Methylicorpusculum oleiharenae TaxID=1338687 RepID=UPI00135CF37C|nr:glycosyltransferase family 2 protein [Methylicorpusculum oleiharenae]MCD2448857.1 glycosyltransferase family 2 protein [Methylicorpusculum oleiharenae]